MSLRPGSKLPRSLLSSDALPLYARTATRLWEDVLATTPVAGDAMPSERALSERYSVSRVTMRAALAQLEQRGLVQSSPARGWFVGAAVGAPVRGHTVQGFADYALEHGLHTHNHVLEARTRPATVAEGEALRIGPGRPLFEMRRLRYLDGLVVVLEHNRLPLALCPDLAVTDFSSASLYATLRAADPPQLPSTADYSVEARAPEAAEKQLLEVDATASMLVATQLAYNQDGQPLELTAAVYRGDRYRFTASITN